MEERKFTPELSDKSKRLVKQLQDLPEAREFLQPVDYKRLGLDDYPNIITYPMDLSTVEGKLDQNSYETLEQFFYDLNMIWENCRKYNGPTSVYGELANKMEHNMKRIVNSINFSSERELPMRRERNTFEEDKTEITMMEKWQLSEDVKKISSGTLAEIVMCLQENCG